MDSVNDVRARRSRFVPDKTMHALNTDRERFLFGWASKSWEERALLISFTGFFCQGPVLAVTEIVMAPFGYFGSQLLAIILIYVPLLAVILHRLFEKRPVGAGIFVPLYGLLLIALVLSRIQHPEYSEVMFDMGWSGNAVEKIISPLASVFALLLISVIRSPQMLFQGFLYSARLNFAYNVIRFVVATRNGYWVNEDFRGFEVYQPYSLGFGYSVLTSVIIFVFLAFRGYGTLLNSTLAAIGVAMIALQGGRGALIFAIAGIVMFALYTGRDLVRRSAVNAVIYTWGLTLLGIVILKLNEFLQLLSNAFELLGIGSRSIDSLLGGTFAFENGRDTLAEISEVLINEGGTFGSGLYGDRFYIRPRFIWGYPHNFFDEIFIQFGPLFGAIGIGLIGLCVVYAFFVGRKSGYRDLIIMTFPLTFQLLLSSSYLLSVGYWALLGVSLLSIKEARRSKGVIPENVQH